MSRRKKVHDYKLPKKLSDYADSRELEFFRYSEYHMRLDDGGYTTIDIWTTRRYYIKHTDYGELTEKDIIERAGEKGFIPRDNLEKWLDNVFYAVEMNE